MLGITAHTCNSNVWDAGRRKSPVYLASELQMERPHPTRTRPLIICPEPAWDRSFQVGQSRVREGLMGSQSLPLNYRPLMDCWGGEATVFGCEITDKPPGSRGHQDGPGRTQRGTDRTKRNDGGKRLAGEGRDGWGGSRMYVIHITYLYEIVKEQLP